MSIRIFVTAGGTFDKEYNEITGELYFKETHLPEMITRSVFPHVEVSTLMMMDSLDMNAGDRELTANRCNATPEDRIIITYGTDTMSVTAAVLAARVPGKTIVLTGAMIPYKFGSSDGFFNLGCALTFVQALPARVYVSMNGRVLPWDNVRKNRVTGVFEEVRG